MLKRIGDFFTLLDHDGNLSLTNIAVIVGIFKMATTSQLTGCDATALIGTLLNYAHKRYTNDASSN